MARITKYLLLALIVTVAFNHAVKAQEDAAEPAQEAETVETEADAEAPAPAPESEAESTVGMPLEEEDNFSLGSIKKVGSWLSKFGWWNIWKGIGLKKAGDWWKWDKIFKEDWWKKKWFVLGSPLEEEESRMMLVLSEPETRSMGVRAEEDATYFLAPPGFENELAKRGIAVNPSIVPVKKTLKKQHHQQQQPQQRPQTQQRSQENYPHQLQNTQYTQSWLQRAFPSLDVYDREGGQGSEIDSVRMRPNTQSLSRSMVASLKKQIPDIIPLGSSAPNTPMYAYDQSGIMRLLPQEAPQPLQQQYEMMNDDTQNPAVLQEYQQARTGFYEMAKNKKTDLPQRIRANSNIEPEGLIVPMPYPRSNSITTKEEIERALNNEQTQKMLEQYARKNWKTIRKDAIILKFVPKADLEARPSVKRQATMIQEQIPMSRHQSPEEINSAYARDFHQWTAQQERAMQEQQFSQLKASQMQTSIEQQPREELPRPAMQGPQEHRQMMTQTPKQMPMLQQELSQSFNDQTSLLQQQPVMQQQLPINQNQQHAMPMTQQEPRQWLQEQPITQQQIPRQWIQEQPQQQNLMFQQETVPLNEPRQWVQEQQWTSVNPSILGEFKPRQMTQHTLDQTQSAQPQQTADSFTMSDGGKIDNKDDQHPIVSEMGPQTEDNARFFKKGYGSGGYGGTGYGRGASYDGGSNPGYESSHGGSYGENSYGSQGSNYGGSSLPSYGSSGHSGNYGQDLSSNYGAPGYGTSGSSGYESSPGGSYVSHGAGYSGSSGPGYGSSGHSGSYGQGHNSNYGGGHGGYGTGGHSDYGSPAGSYGSSAPNYGSSGSYGGSLSGGHGGSYGTGHSGGHGSSYGGGHGGGYRTTDMADTPMKLYQHQDPNPNRSRNTVHNHPISHVDEPKTLSYSSEQSTQNQKGEITNTNSEHLLRHNERTTIAEQHSVADEKASRLASKPNLSFINSNTDYRLKAYRSKRQVKVNQSLESKLSKLGMKKVHRSRRSISSNFGNHCLSKRQVSYHGGGPGYSTLERIPASSLQKLREGYKENLKEITLQPNEDPAEALMRINSQSIQEALFRANAEPIEVNGTPGQTVVHDEEEGQTMMHNQGARPRYPASSNNLHSYQNQWASQSPQYIDNVRSPMIHNNNGNYYPDSTDNATVSSVYPNSFTRNDDIQNARSYNVQNYGDYEHQKYGNSGQPSVGIVSHEREARLTNVYGRQNISPPSVVSQSLQPSYDTQFRNPVHPPNSPVVNNPSYFYQEPTIAQVPQQYSQEVSQQVSQQFPQQFPQNVPHKFQQEVSHQFSQQFPQQVSQVPQQVSLQFPQVPQQFSQQYPQQYPQQIQQQFSQQVPSVPIANYNQLSAPVSVYKAPMMRYSEPLTETVDATVQDYLGDPSTKDLMETIKTRLTNCCNKCKKQILKRINSGIISEDEAENSDKPEDCLNCKDSTEFLSDLKNMQDKFLKNTTPKLGSMTYQNNENTQNTINRQKPTKAMWIKNSRSEDDKDKEKSNDRFINKTDDDLDYDYNLEGDYDRNQKSQSRHRSNQEINAKRMTTRPAKREYQNNDHIQKSGYSYKSRPQTSKSENNRSFSRTGLQSNIEQQQYLDDYEKRRPQENNGYKRVGDVQGRRRLSSRSGPKENKVSGYDYEKQVKDENSQKNSGYTATTPITPIRIRKPKIKQEQSTDSPCKKIQKQLKELESNDDNKQQDILEKKTKLIELLYFLYEMSKCSMGDQQCQQLIEKDDTSSTDSSIAKDSTDPLSQSTSRRVKIPRKKEVKTVDYATVAKQVDSIKNGSDGKKVRSVDNYYYEEEW